MNKEILFPRVGRLIHGGDYNPEQWLDRPDILERDIELMKEAKINCVTLGVFSWAVYEPREGEFHFRWMEEIIDRLYAEGIYTILATPSGARPAWLDRAYPDAMRVDAYGHRNRHGFRHNHCMSSGNYRQKVRLMDTLLARQFCHHPGVILWHISNELGGCCYCDTCKQKFQDYLRRKFGGDINALNRAWWSRFWSHSYGSFDEIEPPYANGEFSIPGLNLEWKRFTTWNMTDFMNLEIDTLRVIDGDRPVTTNFMILYEELDYHQMTDKLDIISWDSYPQFHNDQESLADTFFLNGFNHALFRSMKPGKPFMLMESAPGLINWGRVNKYKRPGIHRLACLQAVACGSDTVQYFQIRKGRGGFEQHHGAVIDHLGTNDTRVFKEVKAVGELLEGIAEVAGSVADNQVALLFDWDNRWAIKDAKALAGETKDYEKTCIDIWKEFVRLGQEPDVISSDQDWSRYKVILAPMLYVLHDGMGDKVRQFVRDGGIILATYFSGYVDSNLLCWLGGFPGDGLSQVFGVISEEIDSFYPTDRNELKVPWRDEPIEVRDYAEFLRVSTAETLAEYTRDYVAGTAAITRNTYGAGTAYYVGCRTKGEDLKPLFTEILTRAGLEVSDLPQGVELHRRYGEDGAYSFYLNMTEESPTVPILPGVDLITGEAVEKEMIMEPYGVRVIKSR